MDGKLIIFSAPSGSGKTTVTQDLLQHFPVLEFSISATTRSPRGKEENGKDYYFITAEEFKKRVDAGEFLEYEEVYPGIFYGTLKSEVERIWAKGHHVIFDLDVVGGKNMKAKFGPKALLVFIKLASLEILKERLMSRNTESPEQLQMRLDKAQREMEYEVHADAVLLNDNLQQTLVKARQLVQDFITGKN